MLFFRYSIKLNVRENKVLELSQGLRYRQRRFDFLLFSARSDNLRVEEQDKSCNITHFDKIRSSSQSSRLSWHRQNSLHSDSMVENSRFSMACKKLCKNNTVNNVFYSRNASEFDATIRTSQCSLYNALYVSTSSKEQSSGKVPSPKLISGNSGIAEDPSPRN